jgi:cytochrome c oxidase subunit 2
MRRCAAGTGGLLTGLLFCTLVAGCGRSPSTLTPEGTKADVATWSWWLLFAVAAAVCLIVIAMTVLAAVFRRGQKPVRTGDGKKYVLVLGVILPSIVFAGVFALSITGIVKTASPPSKTHITIEVIGHQWWWEFRYNGTKAVIADELHVPVGTPVRLRLKTDDVIHSFWIPQITPKMDLIPRRENQTWLSVAKAGSYTGECAEYCGLQHAHMQFTLVAQPPGDFQQWLDRQSQDAGTPTTASVRRGENVFTTSTCATCHTIRGTSADGTLGPDLTHVGSRGRLAGGAIPNDAGHMAGWIANSQSIKPGNKMPPQHLPPRDLDDVVAYLQQLE